MSIGFQAAQLTHATADFAYLYPEEFKIWREECNYVVCLETLDKDALLELENKAIEGDYKIVSVREPDIDDELTAILFVPSKNTRTLLSNLPCLGKQDKRQSSITELKNEVKVRNLMKIGA